MQGHQSAVKRSAAVSVAHDFWEEEEEERKEELSGARERQDVGCVTRHLQVQDCTPCAARLQKTKTVSFRKSRLQIWGARRRRVADTHLALKVNEFVVLNVP